MDNMIFTSEVCGVVLIAPFDKISRPPCSTIRFIVFLSLFFRCFSPFSLYHRTFSLTVRITPHHENGLLHLHLGWCSIFPSETAETLATARVSGVASFSATLVGAGSGTRTHTMLPSTDFESVTSTNSIIPATGLQNIIHDIEAVGKSFRWRKIRK